MSNSLIEQHNIPELVSQVEAAEAQERIWSAVFAEFAYMDFEPSLSVEELYKQATTCSDAFVPLAMLYTLVAQREFGLDGPVPGFCFEGPPGSGKSIQAAAVARIAQGRPAKVISLHSGEELVKDVQVHVASGGGLLVFDNVRGLTRNQQVARILTAPPASFRALGECSLRQAPGIVLAFTGNDIPKSPEVSRTVLCSRLGGKGWYEDLPVQIQVKAIRDRDELLRDVLLVLQAHACALTPPKVGKMGCFEKWSECVPSAIMYAGGPNVLHSCPGGYETTESEAFETLLRLWPFKEPVSATSFVDVLFGKEGELVTLRSYYAYWELRDAVEALTCTSPGKSPDPKTVGLVFRERAGRVRNGRQLTSIMDRRRTRKWQVVAS